MLMHSLVLVVSLSSSHLEMAASVAANLESVARRSSRRSLTIAHCTCIFNLLEFDYSYAVKASPMLAQPSSQVARARHQQLSRLVDSPTSSASRTTKHLLSKASSALSVTQIPASSIALDVQSQTSLPSGRTSKLLSVVARSSSTARAVQAPFSPVLLR